MNEAFELGAQEDSTGTRITDALFPHGSPSAEDRQEVLELYKIMVASSEALVSRRLAVNTLFLTVNGVLLTAVGLFVRSGGNMRLQAGAVAATAVAGCVLAYAWSTLLRSFGQLNTGKFAVIHRLEGHLAAAIYAGEWEALERGENPKVYRTFTSREIALPIVLFAAYLIAAVLAAAIAGGLWDPRSTG